MTDREFFIYTVEDEAPRFARVFQALPPNKLNYQPDPDSRGALELVTYMTKQCSTYPVFLKKGVVDFSAEPPTNAAPKTLDETTKGFVAAIEEAKNVASGMTEIEWDSPATILANGKIGGETTKGKMAWSLLLDLIHQRG